ncbi:MAG: hypothetical protein RIR26_1457 [Pseudomonadota bacterium]
MWQVRSAQNPFLMRKRSFDLAWGAWAGILAVMTAVGAAFAGSQLLLMYPRPEKYLIFKYPSMPRSEVSGSSQFTGEIPLLYLSREGVVVGQISDVSAPVRPSKILISSKTKSLDVPALTNDIRAWVRANMKSPVRYVAVGNSEAAGQIELNQISEIVALFAEINSEEFKVKSVQPAVIPMKIANSM